MKQLNIIVLPEADQFVQFVYLVSVRNSRSEVLWNAAVL